uniref:Retrotransposon protein putative Ty1-copia subclass n=1 Tax=Tanacetum cinerariifolium TaxID=118510 RepID=A0A6L2JIW8_TANCI|nr:retrotransposon protein putative Ty1-copia subclass [Tanacetum cinerariifolium]
MENSKRGSIPMQEKLKLSKSQDASTLAELKCMQNVPYALAVGSIIFLKYLMNTKDTFLVYGHDIKQELRVSCYTDAGYLTNADDLKSQTGYVFYSELPCSKTYFEANNLPKCVVFEFLMLVPSCYAIFDLEPLSLSLNPRSLTLFLVCLDRLCHLVILCLDQYAHTLHLHESLLTISLDNLCLDNLDFLKEDLEYQSLWKPLILISIAAFYDYEMWQIDVKTTFLNGHLSEENVPYALAVGSIMYAVRCTRPDIAFAQNITSRFQQNPGDLHWANIKNILKYLRNTNDTFLVYGRHIKQELRVSCYTDAGYLTNADDLKSQTRYVFYSELPCSKTYFEANNLPKCVVFKLVPSCYAIFDLEPLSLSLNPRSLNLFLVCLDRLCHLAILCLDQHAHTLHLIESLLTITLDNLCLDNLDFLKEDLEYQSFWKILIAIAAFYDYEMWQIDFKNAFLNGHLSEENVPYALAVGSIMYAVRCTRPDIANTKDTFLVYGRDIKRELRVSCYTDAGYLTIADDLKSQTGYVFYSELPCSKTYFEANNLPQCVVFEFLRLVPSCYAIFDLDPLSLSLNLFLVCLDRLCHLAILCLDQYAHTLHLLKSLLTISLDNLCLDNLDFLKEDLEYQSLWKSFSLNLSFHDSLILMLIVFIVV